MYLKHLSLTNFRNFARLDLDVPRRAILLVGSNAQGKTSLLEAVYFLAAFTSFQTHTDRQLVNFAAARENPGVARIVADYERGNKKHRIEVRIIVEAVGPLGQRTRKELLLDGVKRSANEVIGQFNAALFIPQMSQVMEGAPEDRRRYLNLALAQVIPGYAKALGEYQQALTQRNALLKQLAERGGDVSQLDFWDNNLTQTGSQIILWRIQSILELERLAARTHLSLTRGKEVLRLAYDPAYDPLPRPTGQFVLRMDVPIDRGSIDLETIKNGFMGALRKLRSEEINRGVTTIGPHRDDMRFLSNGVDLGDYGSRGQVRTTLLALKLAEVAWMKEKTGEWPVILLDEVMAELDAERRADLLSTLSESEQSLLTTTDANTFSTEFLEASTLWRVQAGSVMPAAENPR
ncbi:MAG: DNA replication/repair protein RecF [Chloroflexi bacterium]|nr:DNA replication/repair protein RecF [Chloroflexota bacterium]